MRPATALRAALFVMFAIATAAALLLAAHLLMHTNAG
jgi:hypothetical protein